MSGSGEKKKGGRFFDIFIFPKPTRDERGFTQISCLKKEFHFWDAFNPFFSCYSSTFSQDLLKHSFFLSVAGGNDKNAMREIIHSAQALCETIYSN